ncbi:polyprenyl diphosphate synthase (plasmid) [Streptomyces sp. NBC_01426]|uniref:polyprenyl diphosphate synthase n=1 Tax=Streptomyces sp. NBC_01426 TaxID=2975866 RepID=UPI002E3220B1|nr:polyprenyl diphosphate synthase [Streptomyces sp. NBC_01426]
MQGTEPQAGAAHESPSLASFVDLAAAPRHVFVNGDGNRRWARISGRSVLDGYRRGFGRIEEIARWCSEVGTSSLSWGVLSTFNVARRPASEIQVVHQATAEVLERLAQDGAWKIRHVGFRPYCDESVLAALDKAVDATREAPGLTLNVMYGYNGDEEVAHAVRELVRDLQAVAAGQPVDESSITAEAISRRLFMYGQPDIDLMIRTGGDQRLSHVPPWHIASTEFHFCPTLFPDFTKADFLHALWAYEKRTRRMSG